jgi:hypothetical protein
MNIKCFFVEDTGKMTPFIDGVSSPIYRRADTGEEISSRDLQVGAMRYVNDEYASTYGIGPDGKSLIVLTPGGWWYIDSRASNCTRPDDSIHKCWCRHGEPPNITVDKNGNTCNAGAGSILMRSYHGFLWNGELTDC